MKTPSKGLPGVEQARDYLGLTPEEIARAIGTDERTLRGWCSGDIRPSSDSIARLQGLDNLVKQMRRTFRVPQAAREWTMEALADLDGRRPMDVILLGGAEELLPILEERESETAV